MMRHASPGLLARPRPAVARRAGRDAAAALARNYPGGLTGFHAAMQHKIARLQLTHTVIEEPTGLSAGNVSSAQDLAKVLRAAAVYPLIAEITSRRSQMVRVNGRPLA